jgi:hypothetical protein
MKNNIRISGINLIAFTILVILSCNENRPTVSTVLTDPVTEITSTTARYGLNVTSDGGAPVTRIGFVQSESPNPTLPEGSSSTEGRLGIFSYHIFLLKPNTLYFVRAFATNSLGTGYRNEVSFTSRKNDITFNQNLT